MVVVVVVVVAVACIGMILYSHSIQSRWRIWARRLIDKKPVPRSSSSRPVRGSIFSTKNTTLPRYATYSPVATLRCKS